MKRHHDQLIGEFIMEGKSLIIVAGPWKQEAGMVAGSFHPDPQAGGRELTGNGHGCLEPHIPHPVIHPLQ